MIPPRRGRLVGEGDYRAIGREFVGHLVDLVNLQPSDRILDVGCGTGRIALALMGYLDENGTYDGFDVNRKGIEFARNTIGREASRFEFKWIDIRNDQYNSAGASSAAEFQFPYDSHRFSCAIATSLFTHLRTAEAEQYVAEIDRVLAPGGRLLATFFLLNDASRDAIEHSAAAMSFKFSDGGAHYEDGTRVGPGVAYEENDVRKWLGASGLELVEPIQYGSWSQASSARTFQDIIVARRS